MSMEIATVPCLADNYAFLVHDAASGATAVVDVPEAAPIRTVLAAKGWRLTDILLTHHHGDHIGGAEELQTATGARITGAAADAHRLPPLDRAVGEGDRFTLGGAEVRVLEVPGHTVGHIAFHIPAAGAAFTGDSLMALGCGRVFEGTPAQMWASLAKLAALPEETLICSGHEYAESNGRFALTIEPGNPGLAARVGRVREARMKGVPTVPSGLAEELATNPFLRAALPAVKAAIGLPDATDAEAFAEVRARKDRFKG